METMRNLQRNVIKEKEKKNQNENRIGFWLDLDNVLSNGGAVVQGRPLKSIVAKAVGVGERATIRVDQSMKLLQITISRHSIHVVPQTLLFNPV